MILRGLSQNGSLSETPWRISVMMSHPEQIWSGYRVKQEGDLGSRVRRLASYRWGTDSYLVIIMMICTDHTRPRWVISHACIFIYRQYLRRLATEKKNNTASRIPKSRPDDGGTHASLYFGFLPRRSGRGGVGKTALMRPLGQSTSRSTTQTVGYRSRTRTCSQCDTIYPFS